ncbi:MAG: hypothetical protein BKP49_06370 [Treponema sp. CETP13]|nr:MAG: hypothetical protein BKP49_06370 [Treponema sp. CETP13]
MTNLFLIGLVLVFLFLFYFAFRYFIKFFVNEKAKKQTFKPKAKKVPCPICNSILYGSETIFTTLYKSNNKKEQVCIIHGCPHCYPTPEQGIKRTCPVCHKELGKNDHLDAYLFNHENKKNHLHITGCIKCGIKN